MAVRIYVDSWDPSYGTGLETADTAPPGQSSAQLGLDVELPAPSWRPLAPAADVRAPATVLLVDGVRRADARIWVEHDGSPIASASSHPGLAASYAAGVVRCDLRAGAAQVVAAKVERGLFTPSPQATDLGAGVTGYRVRRCAGTDAAGLTAAVGPALHALEGQVSVAARAGQNDIDDLLVIDGPLRGRTTLPRALGYVKSHQVRYLPDELSTIVGQLAPGQRCPVFLLGTSWHRYSWYLKLPGPAGAPWAGVVRVEACADLPRGEVVRLADLSAVTLPRLASLPYKDARAPQNLTPIAGLERRLRSMLGDQRLLLRSLMAAATA